MSWQRAESLMLVSSLTLHLYFVVPEHVFEIKPFSQFFEIDPYPHKASIVDG